MVLLNAILQFGNVMLLTSYLAFTIPSSLVSHCVLTVNYCLLFLSYYFIACDFSWDYIQSVTMATIDCCMYATL